MSIIRAIKLRLGLSVTPANNFALTAEADDGTMKLTRESGQDIMTVDAAGKATFPQNVRVWSDQFANRANTITYTNNTGAELEFQVMFFNSSAAAINCNLTVGGLPVAQGNCPANGQTYSLSASVPAGATYSAHIGGVGTVNRWHELRVA